jgi:hypothetical protein
MPMGTEDGQYTERQWRNLTWRPCDHCGASVIAHPHAAGGFGSPEPLYMLAYAECTKRCSGPPTFGNGAYLESA